MEKKNNPPLNDVANREQIMETKEEERKEKKKANPPPHPPPPAPHSAFSHFLERTD